MKDKCCNKAHECNDKGCKHRVPHEPFWWCERPQICTAKTGSGGSQHGVLVECVEVDE